MLRGLTGSHADDPDVAEAAQQFKRLADKVNGLKLTKTERYFPKLAKIMSRLTSYVSYSYFVDRRVR